MGNDSSDGGAVAGSPVARNADKPNVLTGLCPTDFHVDAPCRILSVDTGQVQMMASDIAGYVGGSFTWTTTSTKIQLIDANTPVVTIKALGTCSAARDAEVITVTRTSDGCAPVVITMMVTVAQVSFSASSNQLYGFDDYDTPNVQTDNHVCLQAGDHTLLKVDILGGLTGLDFNFTGVDANVCTTVAPGADTSFDLRINGGAGPRTETLLNATCKCAGASVFASIRVHVYRQRVVNVVVAKFDNPTGQTQYLRWPTLDYAAHAPIANDKLKEAVVKYNISNYDPANGVTRLRYVRGDGIVSYDIAAGGGSDLAAISAAMTGTGSQVRVAIIHDMKSFYYLSAAAAQNSSSVMVTATTVHNYPPIDPSKPPCLVPLGNGATQELVTVTSSSNNTINLAQPLAHNHAAGEPLEFPAGGWSSDPILIMEGTRGQDVPKWTVLHEVGHNKDLGLDLRDIIDTKNFMNWQQSWTDYRLRYCPRQKFHKPDAGTGPTEIQWDTIPRT